MYSHIFHGQKKSIVKSIAVFKKKSHLNQESLCWLMQQNHIFMLQKLHGEFFNPHVKLPNVWILIEIIDFARKKIVPNNGKCDRTFTVLFVHHNDWPTTL